MNIQKLVRDRKPALNKVLLLPVLAGLLSLGCSGRVTAQEDVLLRTITVSGQGEESIATTLAAINLGVEVRGQTAEQVQTEIAERSSQVVTYLKSKQVNKLTTTGISLQPEYDYRDDQRRLIGYIATNTVSFEVANEMAGSIMDEAVKNGATRIDGVSFRATDRAIATAEGVALKEAALEAQAQAKTVLEALGLTSQEVVQIQVNGSRPPQPIPLYRAQALSVAEDAAATPVEGGEQTINASVTLTIRY